MDNDPFQRYRSTRAPARSTAHRGFASHVAAETLHASDPRLQTSRQILYRATDVAAPIPNECSLRGILLRGRRVTLSRMTGGPRSPLLRYFRGTSRSG